MKLAFALVVILFTLQNQAQTKPDVTVSAGIQAKYEKNRAAARQAIQTGDFDKAADLYEQNIAMAEHQKPPAEFEIAEASSDLAGLRIRQHKLNDAEMLLQNSIHAFENDPHPDADRVALELQRLGILYLEKTDFSKAESTFQKSLQLHTSERDKVPWPDAKKAIGLNIERDLLGLASAKLQSGDPGAASTYCNKAISEADASNVPKEELGQLLEQCTIVKHAAGQDADAAELQKRRELLMPRH